MFGSKKGRRKSLPAVNRCTAIDVRHNTQKIPVRIIPGEASADAKNREKQQQSKKPIQLPHKPAMSVPKKRKMEFIDDEEDDPTDISSFPARSAPSSLKRDEDSEPWHDGATVPKAKKGRADGDGRDNANGGRGGRGGRGGQGEKGRGKNQDNSLVNIPKINEGGQRPLDFYGPGSGGKSHEKTPKANINILKLTGSNKMTSSGGQPASAKMRAKKAPAVPVVHDLVSDSDEEDENTGNGGMKPAANASLCTAVADEFTQRSSEKVGTEVLVGNTWAISRAYLGKRGFGSSNDDSTDDKRKMSMRVCEDGIILMPDPMSGLNLEDHTAAPAIKNNGNDGFCTIRGQDIDKISFRCVENDPAKLYYVALYLKVVNLRGFCGIKSLDPHGIGGDDATKYVTIVVGTQGAKEDQKKLYTHITRFCRYHTVHLEQVGAAQDKVFLKAANASSNLRRQWDDEDKKAASRANRREKRKISEGFSSAIGSLHTDNNVYLVYPPEEDATNAITITEGDKRRLEPFQYLNDSLIDLKIRHMDRSQEFSKRQGLWYSYNSLFYSKIRGSENMEKSYMSVERWTKNIDIFDKKLVVVPINEGEHWSVVFILQPCLLLPKTADDGANADVDESEVKEEKDAAKDKAKESPKMHPAILFYDSLGYHSKNKVAKKICDYLRLEYLSKKHQEAFKKGGLTVKNAAEHIPEYKAFSDAVQSMYNCTFAPKRRDIPVQENGYDCGMYVIKYVEWVLRAWPEPTDENIAKSFKKVVFLNGSKDFNGEVIDNDRLSYNRLLESLRPDYEKEKRASRERREEEKKAKRAKKAEIAAAAAAGTASTADTASTVKGEKQKDADDAVEMEVEIEEAKPDTETAPMDQEVASNTDADSEAEEAAEPTKYVDSMRTEG